MAEELRNERYSCPECQAGVLSREFMAYFTWLSGELITVPDFPAWVCDMCGLREYDYRAVSRLNILLNPSTGHSSQTSYGADTADSASPQATAR